jgi:hypothetical protein
MTLIMSEDAEIIVDDPDAGILAVKQNEVLQIWDEEANYFYGTLPEDTDTKTIYAVMKLYNSGYDKGYKDGESTVKGQFRHLLGLDS